MLGSLWFNSFSSGAGASADYELISTSLIASTTASVTFGSLNTIAAAYKHLQLRIVSRNAWSAPSGTVTYGANAVIRFNGDSASNYRAHMVEGASNNGTPFGTDYGSVSGCFVPDLGGVWDSSIANVYSTGIVDILDFSNASKNTTIRTLAGNIKGGQGRVHLSSAAWFNTAAVTSMVVSEDGSGGGFKSGTRISLYGLKG